MNQKLNEVISHCHDSVTRLIAFWHILRFFKKNEKRRVFEVKAFHSDIGLGPHEALLKLVRELNEKNIIKVDNVEGELEIGYGYIFKFKIPKGVDLEAEYEQELEQFSISPKHYALDNQIIVMIDYLTKRAQRCGKKEIYFDHEDVFNEWDFLNPFFTLLYLEQDGIFKIDSIQEHRRVLDRESSFRSYTFSIQTGDNLLRGDTYTIDLGKHLIRFENPKEERILKPKTQAYRLFSLFNTSVSKKVSYERVIQTVSKRIENINGRGKTGLSNDVDNIFFRIRKGVLKCNCEVKHKDKTEKCPFDVLIKKGGFVSLRGLKQ